MLALDQPPDERDAWLQDQYGHDHEILSEVVGLLRAHEEAEATSGLEVSPMHNLAAGSREGLSGRVMGPWQIDELIGEGGMGSVYRGHRADGAYERIVAIKVLRPGAESARLKSRLRTEGQILARLEHPNTARFYDLGVSENGLPYLVLEFVKGESVTAFVRRTSANLNVRLDRFLEACDAVAHAHQNLVIHQDLKPSNILVDETGAVKLLDFGIARLLRKDADSGDNTDAADQDGDAKLFGMTPNYASPEQIRLQPVTTATDIYALGIILYELLTGTRPYTASGLSREELEVLICESAVERPSDRVASVAGVSDGVTARQLRGELDAIVLKAMFRDASGRYASVSDLAQDIRWFRQRRGVSAVPSTTRYRTRTFIRRHRKSLTAALLLAVALIMGLAGTISQSRIAQRERDSAERKFGYAREVAGSLVFDVYDALTEIPGATRVREMIIGRSIDYLDRLVAEPESDDGLRLDIAQAYLRVGNVQGSPINANLGQLADAMVSYQKALDVLDLGMTSDSLRPTAEITRARVLESRGSVRASLGQADSAVADLRQAVALFEEAQVARPRDANLLYRVASAHVKLGDYTGNPNFQNAGNPTEAKEHFERALGLLQVLVARGDRSDNVLREMGVAYERLGVVESALDDVRAASAAYRESFAIRRELFERNPTHLNIFRDMGIGHEKLALMYQSAGELDSARVEFEASEAVYRTLAESDPENIQAQQTLAIGLLHLGDLMWANDRPNFGDRPSSRMYFGEALRILERSARIDTSDVRTKNLVALLESRLE